MADVELTGPENLAGWLKDKPPDWGRAIALRAALRVLPLCLDIMRLESVSPEQQKASVLHAFRAAFVYWAGQVHAIRLDSKVADRLNAACEDAARASADVAHLKLPDSQARAARGAAAAVSAAVFAGINKGPPQVTPPVNVEEAINVALSAASEVDEKAFSQLWTSIVADSRAMESEPSVNVLGQALWLVDVRGDTKLIANFPIWARIPFDRFDGLSAVKEGAWGFWLAWYRAIIPNTRNTAPRSLFGWQIDIEIATLPNRFWARDPDLVVGDLARLVTEPKTEAQIKFENFDPPPQSAAQSQPSTPPPPRPILDAAEPPADEPTAADQLGRRPFAQAIVARMDKLLTTGGQVGFAVHLHAPWGAGKTSVLKMMKEIMVAHGRRGADGKTAPRWVVVDFNAWEHERRNPPWWPLVEAVKAECLRHLSGKPVTWRRCLSASLTRLRAPHAPIEDRAALLEARWLWWKMRADALPYLLAILVFALCGWLLWYLGNPPDGKVPAFFDWILKLFTTATAAYAAFYGASRFALFGSDNAAKLYEDSASDPLARIKKLFGTIVDNTNDPVCVFIDDLDRCRADYVADLLEGVQTSFRHGRVVYVVAADRNWIKASFETRYGTFSSAIGSSGQPLGYLFLEKIFQLSTPVPGMGSRTRGAYWDQLVKGTPQAAPGQPPDPVAGVSSAEFQQRVDAKREDLRQQHGTNLTGAQADAILEASDDADLRAAVVLELNVSRAAEAEAEHLLSRFADAVPDNPRVMKRIVNAFAMRQAIRRLERSELPSEVIARWTILEQRFPALADLLIENPEWTDLLASPSEGAGTGNTPAPLQPYIGSRTIKGVIGEPAENGLTGERVRDVTRGSAS